MGTIHTDRSEQKDPQLDRKGSNTSESQKVTDPTAPDHAKKSRTQFLFCKEINEACRWILCQNTINIKYQSYLH
jgi:hypothetical protein